MKDKEFINVTIRVRKRDVGFHKLILDKGITNSQIFRIGMMVTAKRLEADNKLDGDFWLWRVWDSFVR